MAIFKITSELPANRYHNISSDFRALKQYLGISTKLSSDIAVSQQAHLLETLYLSPVEVTSIGTDDTKLKSNIQMDIKAKPRRNPIPSSLVEGVCASTPQCKKRPNPTVSNTLLTAPTATVSSGLFSVITWLINCFSQNIVNQKYSTSTVPYHIMRGEESFKTYTWG